MKLPRQPDQSPRTPVEHKLEQRLVELALPTPLRPYQRQGVQFLASTGSALLADDMGLGKTVQAIAAAKLVLTKNSTARVLVVVPKALRQNWYQELRHWAPELAVALVKGNRANRLAKYLLPFPFVVATYEQVRADRDAMDYAEKFEVVILDEAQRIKAGTSDTAIACYSLPRVRSWALTGTPLENRPSDLVSLFTFVCPGLLSEGMSKADILEKMKPHFLRRTKVEALPELPPIIDQEVSLELEGRQRQAYQARWESRHASMATGPSPDYASMLALITRLKQLCNYDPVSEESVKLDALSLILQNMDEPHHRVVVFSQFVECLRWLASRLDSPYTDIYHGGLDDAERHTVLRRFREGPGPRVLLMSMKAGGVGLNLPEASAVVLFDRWWNPATENQAVHRAHRFGRTGTLHVLRFLVRNSIEERIDDILHSKNRMFDAYIERADSAEFDAVAGERLLQLLK